MGRLEGRQNSSMTAPIDTDELKVLVNNPHPFPTQKSISFDEGGRERRKWLRRLI
jgi:hypothetical protein